MIKLTRHLFSWLNPAVWQAREGKILAAETLRVNLVAADTKVEPEISPFEIHLLRSACQPSLHLVRVK